MSTNTLKIRVKNFLAMNRISNSEFAEIAGVSSAYVTSIKENMSLGENFKPSQNKAQSRIFRDKWLTIRKELRLPDTYQFYSLKDSGITKMLSMLNVSEVRDQARHSNIAITDVYTDRSKTDGNAHIKSIDFKPSV